MTPAVKVLEKAGVAFSLAEYDHDPRSPAYGEEAARALGLSPEAVFKTLLADVIADLPTDPMQELCAQIQDVAGNVGEDRVSLIATKRWGSPFCTAQWDVHPHAAGRRTYVEAFVGLFSHFLTQYFIGLCRKNWTKPERRVSK